MIDAMNNRIKQLEMECSYMNFSFLVWYLPTEYPGSLVSLLFTLLAASLHYIVQIISF